MIHNSGSSEEILQVFDSMGIPTQGVPRSLVKNEPGIHWCAVVNIWLINQEGKILSSKRSEIRKNGKWQTFFGGHLKIDQSYKEAAVAELYEEIGLMIDSSKLFFIGKRSSRDSLQHSESYIYPFDGLLSDLHFHDGEIVDIRWMELDDLLIEQKNSEAWCNIIKPEYMPLIQEWIQKNKL